MKFNPIQYASGMTKMLVAGAEKEIKKGDPITFSSGLAQTAVNTEATAVRFVALQDLTTVEGEDTTEFLALDVRGVEFEAQTKEDSAQAQVGVAYTLHTDSTVANDSAGHIFVVTQLVGPATAKKVRGYFLDRVNA